MIKQRYKVAFFAMLMGVSLMSCDKSISNYDEPDTGDTDDKNIYEEILVKTERPDSLKHLKLIFQTGFEGDLSFIPWGNGNTKIVGSTYGLEKSDWTKVSSEDGVKTTFFYFAGGDESQRYAKIVPDPKNNINNVLEIGINDWWYNPNGLEQARIQLEFHELTPKVKELYQSVRMYLSEDFNCLKSHPGRITWCTISEFWNNISLYDPIYPFRVGLGIGKPSVGDGDLYFTFGGQNNTPANVWTNIWNTDNFRVPAPIGKWFTMNYYFKDGDRNTGRFYMTIKVDGTDREEIIADIHNYTHHTENPASVGMRSYNPIKLYTSPELIDFVKSKDKTLKIYWDNLKIWRD